MNGINQLKPAEAGERPLAPLTQAERQEFWTDTCREMTQMHAAGPRVIELYRQFGCRFVSPSRQQVTDVLSALDAAMPQWEQSHPELFFQTLELNYPELVRR